MPRSKETILGLRQLLNHLLSCAPVRDKLLKKAQDAVPGTPTVARSAQHGKDPAAVLVTSKQRDWLVNHLAKEYWEQLSEEQRQRYIAGETVPDCPFLEEDSNQEPSQLPAILLEFFSQFYIA